jgi:hypothetical protein
MKVVSYLAGIPVNNKNIEKPDVLKRFVNGVTASGDVGILHATPTIVDCDVAFIQGWTHEHGKTAPHLQFRQAVIDHQRNTHKRVLIVDSNLFNYRNKENAVPYSRFSFDGVFPTTGNYFWSDSDPSRWQQISRDTGIVLKPWRESGNHILICTQRNGGWSMKGLNVVQWITDIVKQIRQYSNRPIIVRPHPGDKKARGYLNIPGQGWTVSTNEHIVDDFVNAWAVVTYNSSPGVAAAIEGIPVFVTDPTPEVSQAFSVANTNLSTIEIPKTFERQHWIERISMCHWTRDELSNGSAWRHMKKYV